MKTIADLKRKLIPGRKITLTFFGGNQHKFLNQEREVHSVQMSGVYLINENGEKSFLDFPRKKEFIPISEIEFNIKLENGILMTYKLGDLK